MKSYVSLLPVLAILSISTLSLAGESGAHGGGGFIKRNQATGAIEDVVFIDLWEGQKIHGMKFPITFGSFDVQVKQALRKLQSAVDLSFSAQALAEYNRMQMPGHTLFLDEDVTINPPNDVKNKYTKTGYTLEGIALYDDRSDRLSLKTDYFLRLSETDKAALYVHEAVYKVWRTWVRSSVESSEPVRMLTACLFAEECDPRQYWVRLVEKMPWNGVVTCESEVVLEAKCRTASDRIHFEISKCGNSNGISIQDINGVALEPNYTLREKFEISPQNSWDNRTPLYARMGRPTRIDYAIDEEDPSFKLKSISLDTKTSGFIFSERTWMTIDGEKVFCTKP